MTADPCPTPVPGPVSDGEVLLAWVVAGGEVRHVSEFASIEPRKRPEAFCPQCGAQVTMRLGTLRAHHVAHRPGDACSATGPETALHLNAKFHVARELDRVRQVQLKQSCSNEARACESEQVVAWSVEWDSVAVEKQVGTTRPDIVMFKAGVPVAAVEIHVTHAVEEEKARYLASLGLPWLEVRGEDVETDTTWHQPDPLPATRQGPEPRWICATCAENIRRVADERLRIEFNEQNGDHEWCGRLVDLYYPSGKKMRAVFLIEKTLKAGVITRARICSKLGPPVVVEGPLDPPDMARALKLRFDELMNVYRRRGAIVDSAMDWEKQASLRFSSDLVTYSDIYYPRRYEWCAARRAWVMAAGMQELRWGR